MENYRLFQHIHLAQNYQNSGGTRLGGQNSGSDLKEQWID